MARNRALLVGMTLALLVMPADALAKKKKGKKGKKGKNEDIVLTGFKSLDKVLKEVADIDARIDSAEDAMAKAKRSLNVALELEKGTPLKDAIADLKVKGGDNLRVAMNGKIPKLTVADAAPTNIVTAVTAVNDMSSALVTSIEDLAGVPTDVKELSKAVNKLPDKAKKEFSGDPIGALFKAPKLIKSLKGNAQVTASLPGRSVDVSKRATSMVTLVGTTFIPAEGGGAGADGGTDGGRGSGGGRTGGGRMRGGNNDGGNNDGGNSGGGGRRR